MTAAKPHPVIVLAVVALFLYWVVNDPVGAAAMIHQLFEWALGFASMLADRLVEFLNALT